MPSSKFGFPELLLTWIDAGIELGWTWVLNLVLNLHSKAFEGFQSRFLRER